MRTLLNAFDQILKNCVWRIKYGLLLKNEDIKEILLSIISHEIRKAVRCPSRSTSNREVALVHAEFQSERLTRFVLHSLTQ